MPPTYCSCCLEAVVHPPALFFVPLSGMKSGHEKYVVCSQCHEAMMTRFEDSFLSLPSNNSAMYVSPQSPEGNVQLLYCPASIAREFIAAIRHQFDTTVITPDAPAVGVELVIPDRPGKLHILLGPLYMRGINIRRISSEPVDNTTTKVLLLLDPHPQIDRWLDSQKESRGYTVTRVIWKSGGSHPHFFLAMSRLIKSVVVTCLLCSSG